LFVFKLFYLFLYFCLYGTDATAVTWRQSDDEYDVQMALLPGSW